MALSVPKSSTGAKSPFVKPNLTQLQDSSGGLNNKVAPYLLEDNELSDVQNFHFDEKGTLTKRKGCRARYASNFDSGGVRGLVNYRKEDGTTFIVAAASDKLYSEALGFQTIFDTKAEWETGTLDNVETTSVPGDIVLESTAGEFGAIELGALSAMFGGNPGDRAGIWTSDPIDISTVTVGNSGIAPDESTVPSGTTRTIQTRTAAASNMAGASAWANLGGGSTIVSPFNNFLQVRVVFTSTSNLNPSVQKLIVQYDATPGMTQIKSGLDSAAHWQFATQNDILFGVNGVNANQKWTGTGNTADAGGSPPSGKYIGSHKNRMFIAGTASNRSRIYFSELGDPENWPALNFIDVGKGDGDTITGTYMGFLDAVVIFKSGSTWLLQGDGPANYVLRKSTGEAGTVSGASASEVKNALGVFAREGVRFFDGVKSVYASEKIEGSFNLLNPQQLHLARGIVFKNHFYQALPEGSSTTNNVIWVFDMLRAAWTIYRGMNVGAWAIWRRYNADQLIFGDSTKGMIYDFDQTYNDDGVAIDAYFETKALFGTKPETVHLLKYGMIDCRETQGALPTSVEIRLRPDNGSLSSPITKDLTNATLNVKRFIPSSVGVTTVRSVSIRGRNAESNRQVSIYGILMNWAAKGIRETP